MRRWDDVLFVRVWQTSPNAKEAAERLGLGRTQVRSHARTLRRAGVPLRDHRIQASRAERVDVLTELAKSMAEVVVCFCGEQMRRDEWDSHRAGHIRGETWAPR